MAAELPAIAAHSILETVRGMSYVSGKCWN